MLDLVRVIKTKSSRFCRSRHKNEVAKYYWKPYFWSDSYFITSIGDNTRMIVKNTFKTKEAKINHIHPRSCEVFYGRGTLLSIYRLPFSR